MMPLLFSVLRSRFVDLFAYVSTTDGRDHDETKRYLFEPNKARGLTTRPASTRVIAGTLIFTLAYTPVLGAMTGSVASAQAVQNSTYAYQYDINGKLIKITDPLGRVTDLAVDVLGRQTQQTSPAPQANGVRPVVQYVLDGQDQLTTVIDPRNLVTSYGVDGLGNQGTLSSPDTGRTNNTYDLAGNLATSTDARGKLTTYSYDAINRVTRIDYASGPSTIFEYDGGAAGVTNAVGKLSGMTDESGTTRYAYDGFGRLVSKTQTVILGSVAKSFTVAYAYGSNGSGTGKLASITYPSGSRVNYLYDEAGQLNRLTLDQVSVSPGSAPGGASVDLLTGISYAPFGSVQSWYWGNSTEAAVNGYARTFDLDGRITSYTLGNVQTTGVLRHITYDAAGRILGYTHEGPSVTPAPAMLDQTFAYDDLDRLTANQSASTILGFAYDLNGNRTQAVIGSNSYASVVDAVSNRVVSTAGPAPAKSNLYDTAGNLLSDGTSTYTYSDRGRLAQASKAGLTTAYAYNGIGQRVAKNGAAIPTGANYFVYDEQGHLLGEYGGTGAPVQETVYLYNTPVVVLANGVSYVYADHLDTPRLIARSGDGAVIWRWDMSDPFGVQPPLNNPGGVGIFNYNLRFPGQVFDSETNNHYNYFRDYDPQTGRYVQSDPIGLAGGINTYAYVRENPLGYSDSSGLCIGPLAIACIVIAENTPAILVGAEIAVGVSTGAQMPGTGPVASAAGRTIAQEVGAARAFSNFRQAKSALGSRPGEDIHHVVEQCQANASRSGFPISQLNSTSNLTRIPKDVHDAISRFYSTKIPGTNMTVRDSLNNLPFQEQFNYGMDVVNKALKGVIR